MADKKHPPQLSLLEKLDLVPAFVSILGTAFYAATIGIFRGKSGAKYYAKHILHAFVRKLLSRLSNRQVKYLGVPTDKAYETFAKQKKISPQNVSLNHGAKGHWIGNKDAKKVIVYYHGGGFALYADIAYFDFLSDMINELNASGKDIAVFFVEYTTTPHAFYPTQMSQAVEAVRHIVHTTGRSPTDVVIGGDSAGGNLTLAVLSHISHPHNAIEPLEVSAPLGGAFAIAPWVTFSKDFPSIKDNENKDIIESSIGSTWSNTYLAGQQKDNYNEPFNAPVEWWKDIKTSSVLIVTGTDDILVSSITKFVEKFKTTVPNTTYLVGQDEPHIAPICNRMMMDKSETQQGKALKSWLSDCL